MNTSVRGMFDPSDRRYIKYKWRDTAEIPQLGKLDYFPKEGFFRLYNSGVYTPITPQRQIKFEMSKNSFKFGSLDHCLYCGNTEVALSDEHIVPEFLNAGVQIKRASCSECCKVTARFEGALATAMFDPIRRWLDWRGKKGPLRKGSFDLDVGAEIAELRKISIDRYPVLIVMPNLYPATEYSDLPDGTDGLFNISVYNLNAVTEIEESDSYCTYHIDLVYFTQMIAKIGYAYARVCNHGLGLCSGVSKFITEPIRPRIPFRDHFRFVGMLNRREGSSDSLHEIELGDIAWRQRTIPVCRVRLFARYGFKSYYVALL